jgi:DNA-binding transcriptional regulator/RsmH inhibitor MraZ
MQEAKEPLREALNIRIGDALASEIDRIAKLRGESASEVARLLLAYGAEVERRLEAQRLMQHHAAEYSADVAGRVVISAEFVPYTWREVAEMREDLESQGEFGRLPRWEDLQP